MRTHFWFRLFNHATLALAGICLVHGEAYFLPILPWCLPPYLVLLVAAFRGEGRWLLPTWAANLLGVLIVVGLTFYVFRQTRDPNSLLRGLPLPLSLVPYTGPFLMALVTVQLFRPRGPRDFWLLQGMGLLQVALGCVLASGPLFGLLMGVYLASAIGCLVLHNLDVPGSTGPTPTVPWLLGFVASFVVAIGAMTVAVFLLTPRSEGPTWDPFQRFGPRRQQSARAQVGFTEEINLNATGRIEPSREEAFHVQATRADGLPKTDLPLDTRFRGAVLETYEDGVWSGTGRYHLNNSVRLPNRKLTDLPDLGPRQYFLTFTVMPLKAGGLFIAEPVTLGPYGPNRIPVVLLDNEGLPHPPLFFEHPSSRTLLPLVTPLRKEYVYRQVVAPAREPDRVPAELDNRSYPQELTRLNVAKLDEWTIKLLHRLASDNRYQLPAEALPAADQPLGNETPIRYQHWELVARALSAYLANSGEYTYTLEQRRKDLTLDPVTDFLINIKQGHCERYATGLALMCRAVGIPSRLIKGFRGVEAERNGNYVVRQSSAHAWVEVLVPREGGGSDWLTLDPTPGTDSQPTLSGVANWLRDRRGLGQSVWQRLIVGYNAESQADVLNAVAPPKTFAEGARDALPFLIGPLMVILVAIPLLWWHLRRRARARARSVPAMAAYERLERIFQRATGGSRERQQTPREFAHMIQRHLHDRGQATELSDLPNRVVDLLYRVRYGKEVANDRELQTLNTSLDRLGAELRQKGTSSVSSVGR